MVNQFEIPRKAAGSNDRRRSSTLQNQPSLQQEQTQTHIENPRRATDDDLHLTEQRQFSDCCRSSTTGSQLPHRNERPQAQSRTTNTTRTSVEGEDRSSSSSEEWDMLEPEKGDSTTKISTPSRPPSYDFPGTWDAAFHDSNTALAQVGSASASYVSALSRSGLGKASWSIGSALLSTTNRSALSFAGWAVDRTGATPHDFPAPVQQWLRGKSKLDDARWRAREAELTHLERRASLPASESSRVAAEPRTFGDNSGKFVLELHEMDATGEFVGSKPVEMARRDDGFETARTSFSAPRETKIEMKDEEVDEFALVEEEEEEEGREVGDDGLVRMFRFDN